MTARISRATLALCVLLSLAIVGTIAVAATLFGTTARIAPLSISTISDPTLPSEVQATEAETLAFAVDRDLTTEHVLFGEGEITLSLEAGRTVSKLRMMAPAPYTLSVERGTPQGNNINWSDVAAVQNVDLSTLPAGWNDLEFGGDLSARQLRLVLVPVAGGAGTGLAEIEVWGSGQSTVIGTGVDAVELLGNANSAGPVRRIDLGGGTLRVSENSPTDTASFDLPYRPEDIRAAWLTYELRGVHSWLAVRRAINGAAAEGGYVAAEENSWSAQAEPISPEQLVQGTNSITFGTLAGQERDYSVRSAALVIQLDDGHGLVMLPDLTDDDTTTGRLIFANTDGVAALSLPLIDARALDTLTLTFDTAPNGGVAVTGVDADGTETPLAPIPLAAGPDVTVDGLSYTIALDGLSAAQVDLVFDGVPGTFSVVEADASGSPVAAARVPERLALSWPRNGEFYGRTAFLRGHVLPADNGSGAAQFYVAGLPFNSNDGSFEVAITKDQAGFANDPDDAPWTVEVVALYPNGESAVQNVILNNPVYIEGLSTYTPGVLAETFNPGEEKTVTHEEAELTVTADALTQSTEIRVSALTDIEVPKLDTGLINVTKGPRHGYRMLPHMTFNANVRLKLPFNRNKLPQGYTEEDVRLFYFDEDAGRWIALAENTVDAASEEVTGETNHFTDFIAGVVVAPESPQVASYNPTQLKDMKVADPSAKINLIAAPQATSSGDATMSYPIELPPGRQGMAPQLALQYSSGGGNSWMGLGWNLSTMEVTVDTRWGVPRYSRDDLGFDYTGLETETYLLNGQQLTPVYHRTAPEDLPARQAERVFRMRVEGSFMQIVRHGSTPTDYWWEVTDKMGTVYSYGGTSASGQLGSATLADASGNVYKWALAEVRDTNGNTITYGHETVTDTGLVNGTVPGRQLYCTTINYTGHNGTPGAFTVNLIRDRDLPGFSRRNDTIIDGRGGFKMVTADLLKRIEVSYAGDGDTPGGLVRAYDFDYVTGAFHKTLLSKVTQTDTDGTAFNSHTFEYFDDAREANGDYKGFEPASDWISPDDNIRLNADLAASVLGGYEGDNTGGHLYVGLNLSGPTKQGSFGFKIGSSGSVSEGRAMLIDLNGDGLPDKVTRSGDVVSVRLNQLRETGATAFGALQTVANLSQLHRETTDMSSLGFEAYPGPAFVGGNLAWTDTLTEVFFSDVNGDGLPDLVSNGSVLYNRLLANDVPEFVADVNLTAYPVGTAVVDGTILDVDFSDAEAFLSDANPLADNVRAWTAPYTGTVSVAGTVALIEDTSPERAAYLTADGVRVSVEQGGIRLVDIDIAETDYTSKPAAAGGIAISKGEQIYFRIQSKDDGAYDQVSWSPVVTYSSIANVPTPNGFDPATYDAAADFTGFTDKAGTYVAPFDGTVRVAGTLNKATQTTDDVAVELRRNGTVLFTQTLAWNATGAIALAEDVVVVGPEFDVNGIQTQAPDELTLTLVTDSPIDLSALTWTGNQVPTVHYIASTDPDLPVVGAPEDTETDLNPATALFGETDLTAPLAAYTATETGSATATASVSLTGSQAADVTVTVKSGGALIAKSAISVPAGGSANTTFAVPITTGEDYFFEFSSSVPGILASVSGSTISLELPSTTIVAVPTGFNAAEEFTVLPQPYRGWKTFGYNGNGTRAAAAISITQDDLEGGGFDQTDIDDLTNGTTLESGDIADKFPKLFILSPTTEAGAIRWASQDKELWTEAAVQSASRFGRNSIEVFNPAALSGTAAGIKLSTTDTLGFAGSVGFGPVGISASGSQSMTTSVFDYMDINGDRFPDMLSTERRVQFSPMVGGLEGSQTTMERQTVLGEPQPPEEPRSTSGTSFNKGLNGNFPMQTGDGKGLIDIVAGRNTSGNTGLQMQPLGFSASISDGTSEVTYDLRDMNADGLPDIVEDDGTTLSVRFNLGYEFAPSEPFGAANINLGESKGDSRGGSIGFNSGNYGFGGGLNESSGLSWSTSSLADVNGDGLLDKVWRATSAAPDATPKPPLDYINVQINTGSGFDSTELQWYVGRNDFEVTLGNTLGDGIGVFFTIPICIPLTTVCIIINPGGDTGDSMSRQEFAIQDIDGDGFPEYLQSASDDQLSVSFDTVERTNMLRRVNRPLGSTVTLAYERSGNTTDQPQNKWVMSRVEVFDGFSGDGDDLLATNFTYADGQWDREEREFYGYATVTEDHMNTGAPTESVYRTITREFLNQSYYEKGLLARSTTADGTGNLFLETLNAYDIVDVDTGVTAVQQDSLTGTHFPQLIRTDNLFYEGLAVAGKATYQTFAYDTYGNVIEFFDAANLNTTDDDVRSTIAYHEDLAAYIVGKADNVVVTDAGGAVYRTREAIFAPGTGNMTQLRSILAGGGIAVTDLTYDSFGNLASVTGPENLNAERYALTYTFDPSVNTYVTAILDSFGYSSAATYDERFGELLSTTDLNAQPMTYTLDNVGRIVTVTGPYEAGSGEATIEFAYNPNRIVAGDSQYAGDPAVSWALTQHIDVYRDISDDIETALFIDGLGRVLQTKKDAAIYDSGAVADRMVASGRITFDFLGRQTEQYYPVEEPLGQQGTFNATYDGITPTITQYDILDRPTTVIIPDGSATTMTYDFGPDRLGVTQFRTLFVDAEQNRRETYADVRKLMTSVKEINPAGGQPTIWTSYDYDPLRQITDVTDDQGNLTTAEYDNFGRMTALDSPDMGRTTYTFDLASNLTAKQTANLAATGQSILYDYTFNRLDSVTYPNFTENNVTYSYGAPGAADNRANRITTVTSEGGTEERFYGPLGEMVRQIKTINSDTQGNSVNSPEVYETLWTFDTWNRVQEMTYPDGEILTNTYDSGGKLQQIDGAKTGFDYPYLQLMGYDKFGQRTFLRAGNGTETSYAYVPTTRRLDGLQATSQQTGRTFQDLSYGYDLVGNILSQSNAAGVNGANELGGATSFTYQYDDLYRLTGATGSWEYMPNKTEEFTLDMSYDTIHNIVAKDQLHERVQPSGTRVTQKKTSYDWTYTYGSPQPHAPSLIGDRAYSYDANGNQTGWDHVQNGTRRTIVWDEENRIQEVSDNGHTKTYKYDDAGERVIKRGPQGETAYINQFFTMRNREVGTKHVFAGGTRLVSKLVKAPNVVDLDGDGIPDDMPNACSEPWGWTNGNGGQGNGQGPCNNNGNGGQNGNGGNNSTGPEVFEKDQYYYHPDHLGSSSYVTDLDGEIFQHLEYFPFGETWVEEHSNTQRTPYLFTSKELDEEIGLYYFGARYYDPRTSVWQSPDPILASYMKGEPADGVFVSANLALYGYVQNRPIVAVDPNGEYCVAVAQTVTCRLPGQDNFPAFSFARPDGWPTYTGQGAENYHIYVKAVDTNGASDGTFGNAMRNVIVNDPTPNDSDRPATQGGTANDATPSGGMRNFFGSMVNNDVKSYLFEDNSGNPFIVNVTEPTHTLAPGYVLRGMIVKADGTVMLIAIGEGTGAKQAWGGASDRAFNNVWWAENMDAVREFNEENPAEQVEGRIIDE